ncbi:MAG: ADP-glyceromanno-heptose 6-epimerase [Verrucomicrobia bacterium CG_4_10_14_3_um_filter_43_23]|nr:MAG: ADP-glyceromanno-heptose 6-epimerase [Verrucomicrobia bacterium CG1_02_43_26]PIP60130.1 MAG: ADP-glyceromanno-heptose 6-epimerase [Verrucomicrobia bacterium CG22_combo_CG10-13_8_21_14_all_43_17]PIX58766.1 MAG: ADP-glyceromanno-heptose 6-epimerase [Verrucomicrobia bacterium CG_4_10_14_3_um_filter_43_23]PIY62257.1 MAG: ADP-glyceromanno-heptose 6-epimerase [Verrucomicrobia bacterium CG_4_10_14_0_8_um_filter_43_34]PJA43992.1 MAG: ADP-glyceromanno-heptose 6-epimerase [Verrucomicrobia bacteri
MHDITKGAVLVTGGAGFIGSALIWALNQRGIENIYVTDFLGHDEKFKNLVPLRYRDYLEGDQFMAMLSHASGNLFRDVTTVFHLGACSSTTEKNCRYLIENNFEYTKNLASWAMGNKARFVYASSAATYGDGAQGMDDRDEDISKLRPLNMYGYSKHMFDLFAWKHQMLNQMVGLKYFNVYGPNEGHKEDMRSVVHKAFGQIEETGIIKLFKSYLPEYKDGEQMRDFLYVKDAVEMTIHLAENNKANGLFNLGSGKAHTWLDLASAIFKALNKKMNIEFIDMPETLRSKYQYYTCADISKLRATGYDKEIYPLEEAVRDYVQNYLMTGKPLGDELITANLAGVN